MSALVTAGCMRLGESSCCDTNELSPRLSPMVALAVQCSLELNILNDKQGRKS